MKLHQFTLAVAVAAFASRACSGDGGKGSGRAYPSYQPRGQQSLYGMQGRGQKGSSNEVDAAFYKQNLLAGKRGNAAAGSHGGGGGGGGGSNAASSTYSDSIGAARYVSDDPVFSTTWPRAARSNPSPSRESAPAAMNNEVVRPSSDYQPGAGFLHTQSSAKQPDQCPPPQVFKSSVRLCVQRCFVRAMPILMNENDPHTIIVPDP